MPYIDPNQNPTPNGSQRPLNAPQLQFLPPVARPPRFWQIVLKDLAMTVVGVVLFCFICFMVVFCGLAVFFKAMGDSVNLSTETTFTETTIEGDDSKDGKVVVLPIEGIIQTDEKGFLHEAISAIREDGRVRALVLRVNSPGGTISGSDYYLHLLKQLKADLGIPVVVSMGDMAASGGYYISTVGDKIFAERSTTTGSIGVIVSMYNAAELCKKIGVRSNAITSGAMKGMGDFMKEPSPEETAIWQKTVNDAYEQFLSVVKDGRAWYRGENEQKVAPRPQRATLAGVNVKIDESSDEPKDQEVAKAEENAPAETSENAKAESQAVAENETEPSEQVAETEPATEEKAEVATAEKATEPTETSLVAQRDAELRKLADGRIYSAQDAKDLHLIDEIGFLDDAIAEAVKLAGLEKANVQITRYDEQAGIFNSLIQMTAKKDPLGEVMNKISAPKGYYVCPRALP